MKRLNRKGFTLIELLAIIVILAIIVVVTVPSIIITISNARVQSIWNLAGGVANSYDTAVAQDLLATTPTLKGANATASWQCMGSIMQTTEAGGDTSVSLADVLDLSASDLVLTGNPPTESNGNLTVVTGTCSAIRVKANGAAEVLLVANTGGRFAISGKTVYALSSADAGVQS